MAWITNHPTDTRLYPTYAGLGIRIISNLSYILGEDLGLSVNQHKQQSLKSTKA